MSQDPQILQSFLQEVGCLDIDLKHLLSEFFIRLVSFSQY